MDPKHSPLLAIRLAAVLASLLAIGSTGRAAEPPGGPAIAHDKFCEQGAWRFRNFRPPMTLETFRQAFDLGPADYLNPVTWILFAVIGRETTGSCTGMCHLAVQGAAEGSVVTPFSGTLTEPFYARYELSDRLRKDLAAWHWRQFSVRFLTDYTRALFDSPVKTAQRIEQDIRNRKYGMLSISHGWSGHTLVPVRVERQGVQILIHVYDPNLPWTGTVDPRRHPPITVSGMSWSYPRRNSAWTHYDGRLVYVPFSSGQAGWRDMVNSVEDCLGIALGWLPFLRGSTAQ